MPDRKQDDFVFYEEPRLLDVYRRDAGDGHYTEGIVVGKQVNGTFERGGRTHNRWSATLIYDGQSEWRFDSHTRFFPGASGQWTRTAPTRAVVVEPVVVVRQDVTPAENLGLVPQSEAPAIITGSYEGVGPEIAQAKLEIEARGIAPTSQPVVIGCHTFERVEVANRPAIVQERPVLTASVGDSEAESPPRRRRRFGG